MKQNKNIRVAVVLLTLLLLLGIAACTHDGAPEKKTSTRAPNSTAASETATAESTTAKNTTAETAAAARSDADFEKYFKKNPISAIQSADGRFDGSVTQILTAFGYAITFWQNEIPWAYDRLVKLSSGSRQAKFQAEKQQYLASHEQDLEKALNQYKPMGGSEDRINRAGIVLEFYEAKAKKVYRELYQYDGAFDYYINSADAKNAEIVQAYEAAKNFYANWIFGQEYQDRDTVRSISGADYSPIRHNRVKTYADLLAEAKLYFTDEAARAALKIIGARNADGKLYTFTLEGVGSPPRMEKLYTYRSGDAEWTLKVTVYDLTQEKDSRHYLSDFDLHCVKQNGAWVFGEAEEFGNVI